MTVKSILSLIVATATAAASAESSLFGNPAQNLAQAEVTDYGFQTFDAPSDGSLCSMYLSFKQSAPAPEIWAVEQAQMQISYSAVEAFERKHIDVKPKLEKVWEEMNAESTKLNYWLTRFHTRSTFAYAAYWVLAGFGHGLTSLLREFGVNNWLTLHYSNLFVGLGFIGIVDHSMSMINPRLRTPGLIATAVLFSLYNAGFELAPTPRDWGDFMSGEVGLMLYVIINSYVEFKLKNKQLGFPESVPLLERIKAVMFPLARPGETNRDLRLREGVRAIGQIPAGLRLRIDEGAQKRE